MPEPVSIALGLYLAGYASLRAHARPGSAVSEEARIASIAAASVGDRAERSEALFGARARVLQDLARLAVGCSTPDWDGYGAKAVDPWALQLAERLIRAFPDGLALPEVGVEPDGSVALEWICGRYRRLALSVQSDSRLAYAWLDGTDKGHAVTGFDGTQLSDRLLADIRRIADPTGAFLRAA